MSLAGLLLPRPAVLLARVPLRRAPKGRQEGRREEQAPRLRVLSGGRPPGAAAPPRCSFARATRGGEREGRGLFVARSGRSPVVCSLAATAEWPHGRRRSERWGLSVVLATGGGVRIFNCDPDPLSRVPRHVPLGGGSGAWMAPCTPHRPSPPRSSVAPRLLIMMLSIM